MGAFEMKNTIYNIFFSNCLISIKQQFDMRHPEYKNIEHIVPYLQKHLDSKNSCEDVIEIGEDMIALALLLYWVFCC